MCARFFASLQAGCLERGCDARAVRLGRHTQRRLECATVVPPLALLFAEHCAERSDVGAQVSRAERARGEMRKRPFAIGASVLRCESHELSLSIVDTDSVNLFHAPVKHQSPCHPVPATRSVLWVDAHRIPSPGGHMPRPCTVCTHIERSTIDVQLSQQRVNVSAVAKAHGLKRMALVNHRQKHLPAFLQAFTASADSPNESALQAEAQRLYLASLDALAAAERGVLIGVDSEGLAMHRVSMTAVAACLREARANLASLLNLARDAQTADESPRASTELGSRMSAAVRRLELRALGDSEGSTIEEADVVGEDIDAQTDGAPHTHTKAEHTTMSPASSTDHPSGVQQPHLSRFGAGAPGPGDGGARSVCVGGLDSAIPSDGIDPLTSTDPDHDEGLRAEVIRIARANGYPISDSATMDELRAEGFPV